MNLIIFGAADNTVHHFIKRAIKYVMILIAIPFLSIQILAQESQPSATGKGLFEHKCARCHGKDGTKGAFGAKNLQTSKMNDDELYNIIFNGKKIMPSWGKRLSETQIKFVIEYIKSLRQ